MRFLWLRARAFVHATEDEERVKDTLLWLIAQEEAPRAHGHVNRQRTKGHYGNEILLLEATLKRSADVENALGRLLADAALRDEVTESLLRRIDEDRVLHLRIDKQAAVGRRVELTAGSDAVVITVKADPHAEDSPRAWSQFFKETIAAR